MMITFRFNLTLILSFPTHEKGKRERRGNTRKSIVLLILDDQMIFSRGRVDSKNTGQYSTGSTGSNSTGKRKKEEKRR